MRDKDGISLAVAEARNRREAHALLCPISNGFTAGFDTADAKDARALLDELSKGW